MTDLPEFDRLWATYVTDTHETLVFEGIWERPPGKEPYIKWIRLKAQPLKEAP